ncbi:MAG: hypothetical protein ABSA52_21065, partial [Candidatus Binatia bacterium]
MLPLDASAKHPLAPLDPKPDAAIGHQDRVAQMVHFVEVNSPSSHVGSMLASGPAIPKSGANAPARAIRRVGRRCGRLTPAGRPAVVGEWAEPNC